jgi:hypothetical protein
MVRAQFARSFAVVVVFLICSLAAIARAEDDSMRRAASNYGGEPGINHNFGNGSPLLPCPRSVPCLPAARYGEAGHPPPAVASAGLLPCPLSVPCFATRPDMDLPVRRKAAPAGSGALRPIASRSRSAGVSRLIRANASKTRSRMVVASGGEARNLTSARRPKAVSGGMALRGDAAYQWQARRLLSEVQLKLGRLDRATLDPNKSQIYAKASDFTREGFKALRANDNLAALGFAEKAKVLSADLGA